MPQSTFKAIRTVTIDRISPAVNASDLFRLGALVVGSGKSVDRRVIHAFNLHAPDDGLPLDATSQISAAELLGNVTGVLGAAYSTLTERLTRADYDYLTATWNQYKAGTAWTMPGGDVASDPVPIFTPFPSSTGDIVVCSTLAAMATDALANRGGALLLRWSIFPSAPAQSEHVTIKAAPATDSDITRLRVTYTSLVPAPEDRPARRALRSGTRAASPTDAASAARAGKASQPARAR